MVKSTDLTKKHLPQVLKPPKKASQTLSTLESFRRNPRDIQTALELTETHSKEVAQRYLQEAALTSPDLNILTAGVNYFKRISDWQNYIPLIEKSLAVLKGKPNKKFRAIVSQLWVEKANAHLQLKSFDEAKHAIKKAKPKELPKSYIEYYISILSMLEMRDENFEGLVKHLNKIRHLVPPEAMNNFIHAQLAATVFHCAVVKPSKEQASRLVKSVEMQQEEGSSFDSYALTWLYLCADLTANARQIYSEATSKEGASSSSFPLEPCILEQEGKIEAARQKAVEGLDMVLKAKQNKGEPAIAHFNFKAIFRDLIRIADVPEETYAALLSDQTEQTKAAATEETLPEADPDLLNLIFSIKPRHKGKKSPNSFQAKFDQAFVHAMTFHLKQLSQAFGSDLTVQAKEHTIAKLNRLSGTHQQFKRELAAAKDSLAQAVDVLMKYGFAIKTIEKNSSLTIDEISTTESLSPLEAFRRDPSNLDQALELSKTNYDEVAAILKYELENPTPSKKAIDITLLFFEERTEESVEVFQKFLARIDELDFYKSLTETRLSLKALLNLHISTSYRKLGQLDKAREALTNVSLKHLPPEKFKEFLQHLNLVEKDRKNYLAFLNRIKKFIPLEAKESYEMFHLAARLLATRFIRPSPEEAKELSGSYEKIYESHHPDIDKAVDGFTLIWIWLCNSETGAQEAREFIDHQKSSGYFKNPFEIATTEAIILDREGKTEEARSKAQQVLAELSTGRSNKNEAAITFCTFRAVMEEIQRLAQEPAAAAEKPETKITTETQSVTSLLADAIFCDWDLYREVFPKDRRDIIRENLEKSINNSTNALQGEKIEDYIDRDIDILEGKNTAESAAEKLGISSITLSKGTLNILFHLKDDKIVNGRINNNLDLEIENVSDLHDLRLAGRFLLAVILEKLVETLYEGVDSPTVEEALMAEPDPIPNPVQVTPQPITPESAAGASQASETAEVVAGPRVLIETVEVPEPDSSAPSPQEIFFKTNKQAFQNLRKAISDRGIDVIDLSDTSVAQIPDLQTVIGNQRVVDEAPDSFRVKPYSWDPLAKVIDEIRIYGPRNGKALLKEAGVEQESLAEFGFGSEDPSAMLSVVEFRFGSGKKLIGVLDRSGDLIIPGDGLEEEAIYCLNRTALECLAGIVVPDAEAVYQNAGLSPSQRQERIREIQEKEPQEPSLRSRTLPALLVLRDGSLKSVGKAIRVLMTEAQKAELAKKPLLKWDLFTRTFKKGKAVYEPFPDDEAQRSKLLDRLPHSQIYVRLREGYSYRLPVWEKTANGKTYLLPWEMSNEMQEAAKGATKLDFRTRLYLYAVLHYMERDNEKLNAPLIRQGVIPVIQPKVSVIPERDFSTTQSIMPEFRVESFNGFRLLVHKTVSESDVLRLLMTAEAGQTIRQWHQNEIPPELNSLPKERRNKIPQQAREETPDRQYLMIAPNKRGFNQGIFISLEEVKKSGIKIAQ
jgi:hypothetical protein